MKTKRYGEVIPLRVAYDDKDIARDAGAKWWVDGKRWVWPKTEGELPDELREYVAEEPPPVSPQSDWQSNGPMKVKRAAVIGESWYVQCDGKEPYELSFTRFPINMFVLTDSGCEILLTHRAKHYYEYSPMPEETFAEYLAGERPKLNDDTYDHSTAEVKHYLTVDAAKKEQAQRGEKRQLWLDEVKAVQLACEKLIRQRQEV